MKPENLSRFRQLLFPTGTACGRLGVVGSRAMINLAVDINWWAVGNRISRVAQVSPIYVRPELFNANLPHGVFLDLNRQGLVAAPLLVCDLPQISDRGSDLASELLTLWLGQRLEEGVKDVHAITIANAFAERKHLLAEINNFCEHSKC